MTTRSKRSRTKPSRTDFRRSPRSAYGLVALVIGLVVWAALFYAFRLNAYVTWLLAWGLTAFGFYGFDKVQAQASGWRVPEVVLMALALLGSAIGALLGMLVFRHKTLHGRFWLAVAAGLVLQAGVAVWLMLR